MYAPGHVGLALLVFAPLGVVLLAAGRGRLAAAGVAVSMSSATLPDLDLFVASFPHRGLTHTLAFAVLAGFALGAVVAAGMRVGRAPRRTALAAGTWTWLTVALSVCSHLFGDVVTPMGIRPFVPVSDVHLTLSLVYSRNPQVNLALLSAGAAVTATYWWRGIGASRRGAVRASAGATLRAVREAVATRLLVRWTVSLFTADRRR